MVVHFFIIITSVQRGNGGKGHTRPMHTFFQNLKMRILIKQNHHFIAYLFVHWVGSGLQKECVLYALVLLHLQRRKQKKYHDDSLFIASLEQLLNSDIFSFQKQTPLISFAVSAIEGCDIFISPGYSDILNNFRYIALTDPSIMDSYRIQTVRSTLKIYN